MRLKDVDEAMIDDNVMEDDDPNRFEEGREGDHLMCPFQCDECMFWNLKGRRPMEGEAADELVAICIRRAILDSFWARERSTVAANLREGKRYAALAEMMGIADLRYPRRGPYPVGDTWGMTMACVMLIRSMDTGKNASTIQYETMRKLRSHLSNFSHTCPDGVGATFVADEGNPAMVTHSVTNSFWFKRFMRGCHMRMGDVWIPDRPILIVEIKACLKLLELDWTIFEKDPVGKLETALTACVLVGGFFAALRGEVIVRMDVGAIRAHWDESVTQSEHPHIPLMLAGRFKNELGEKLFCQPLALQSKSGVMLVKWFHRGINMLEAVGVTKGPMFRAQRSKNKRASTAELDVRIHALLKRVQLQWPNIIGDEVDVEQEFSCFRSLRRGATAEAQNAQIPKEVIEANNRWRKHSRARGLVPGMSMMERYSDAKASVPALIRFSGEL